jgi:hypothetical protein
MAESATFPKVVLKKKQIPTLIDFCLEESIEFNVKQQNFPDTDWEVELKIKEIKTALLVGMFLRDNKFEISGIEQQRIVKKPVSKKGEDKTDKEESEPKSKSKSAVTPLADESESPTLM